MKIVNKLVLILGVVIFLVIGLGIAGGLSVIWMRRCADDLEKASHQASQIANLNVMTQQWVVSAEFILRGEPLYDYFYLNTVLLEEHISSIVTELLPQNEKDMISGISISFNQVKKQVEKLINKTEPVNTEVIEVYIRKLLKQLEVIMDNHKLYMDKLGKVADNTKDVGKYISIGIPSACVILAIFLGVSMGRSIIYSMKRLVSATKTMAMGDLTREVGLRSRDEFGEIAKAFDDMREGLRVHQDCLKELNKTLEEQVAERKRAERKLISYQKRLKSLASELSSIEEKERRRIASELHDRIGQTLVAMNIKLVGLRELSTPNERNIVIDEIRTLLEETVQDTRTLTFELSPPVLYELGFEPAVEWLIEQFQEQHKILIELVTDEGYKPLVDDIRILLFKSLRELLTNIVKHARAHSTKVLLKNEDGNIRIVVEDDGVGFDISGFRSKISKAGGFGLFNIRERLEYLGGHLEVVSKPGHGTQITLTAPLKQEKETII
jgi:signal transduction histidine kinase